MEAFWGTNFTSAKLLFYFLFWGVHIGLFAAGWYVLEINAMDDDMLTIAPGMCKPLTRGWLLSMPCSIRYGYPEAQRWCYHSMRP